MPSISPSERAGALLERALGGQAWPAEWAEELAGTALSEDEVWAQLGSRALFSELVEPLADRFDARLCDEYARLFSIVLARALPGLPAPALLERYEQVRRVRPVEREPRDVYVLSRVTLGADVAITSLVLDAAKTRFPRAQIWLAGPTKAWELFERDPRLRHLEVSYGRTALLRDRLGAYAVLREALASEDALLLDPDSRLTQLGLLPVCDASRHHLFESRSYGGESDDPLPVLTSRWVEATLGVQDAEPYLHPKYHYDFGGAPVVTASLGVGENPAKRVSGEFESGLVAHLASLPAQVFLDVGAPGGEEEARVRAAVAAAGEAGERLGVHAGSFASFAAMIAASRCYVGYDSAGQHVAAALGVPVVTVFHGFPCERMLARWTPSGPGPVTVLRADRFQDHQDLLRAVRDAIKL